MLKKIYGVSFFIAFLSVGFLPVYAATCPDSLSSLVPNNFSMSFDGLSILNENGSVENALNDPAYKNVLFETGISNNAVKIKDDSYMSFSSNDRIDPSVGKISFWFKPEWNGYDIGHTRMLLDAGSMRVFVYKSATKNYFVFRYDDAGGNQREVSTSSLEPQNPVSETQQGIVSRWQAGEWHHIEVTWDLTLDPGEQYLSYTLDGEHSKVLKNTWNGINPLSCSFSVGSRLNGLDVAEGGFDELRIDTETDREVYLSLNNASSITSVNGSVDSQTQFESAQTGNGLLASNGVDVSIPVAGNLDVEKGRATFWFKPEWNGNDIGNSRYLIDAGPFRVFIYKGSNKNYFVFRFDDANGGQREVSSSSMEPDVVESWQAGEWHFVDLEWDLTLPVGNQYLKYTIDETHTRTLNHQWQGIQTASTEFSIGSKQNGIYAAGGVIDELEIYSLPQAAEFANISFFSSLESAQGIADVGGVVNGNPVFSAGYIGQGMELKQGDQVLFPTSGHLNKMKGSVSFNFKPNWNGSENTQIRYLFDASPFRSFVYYKGGDQSKTYFVFRFDDALGQQREVSTSAFEPVGGGDGSEGVVSAWKAGEWHSIELMWDLSGEQQYLTFAIDGVSYSARVSEWSGIQELPDDFSLGINRSGAFPADGLVDELTIYNEVVFDIHKPVESYVETTRNDGIWQPHETIYTAPQDAPRLSDAIAANENYIFYQKPNFEAVYEGTVPTEDEIKNEFQYRVAANERETLYFNLYSRNHLNEIFVSASTPTKNPNASLDVNQLFLVKNWWQAGETAKRNFFPHYVPELLISDDITGDGKKLSDINEIRAAAWTPSDLPSLPIFDYVHTDMQAYTSRQFAFQVYVPENTTAGSYYSMIQIHDATGALLTNIPLKIEVEAYNLRAPEKDYWTYHRALLLDESTSSSSVSLVRYQKQIEDIQHHGLTGLLMYGSDITAQTTKLSFIQQTGWDAQIMLTNKSEALRDLLDTYGYEPWFYGKDEPNNDERIVNHINQSYLIHGLGDTSGEASGKVITAIKREWAEKLLDPSSYVYSLGGVNAGNTPYEPLDYANLSLHGSISYIQGLVDGTTVKDNYSQSYYWQSMQENPSINRSYAGYYLWLTGLNGVFPYVYQDVRNNPYDDFDIWSNTTQDYRDHLTTYPSQEGPVGTIQWEAYREGIDDVRYMRTWTYYYDQALNSSPVIASVSKQRVDNLLNTFKNYKTLRNLSASKFELARSVLQEEIRSLIQATAN